jgi:hypothetical protein
MDLRETWWGGMDWNDMAQDRDQWWAFMNMVMNFQAEKGLFCQWWWWWFMVLWEPPTMQNRQLPPCSKSRCHLYPTDYWNTAQALPNQRQQLKLEWSLVSAQPAAMGIKMRAPDMVRFTVTLSTREHLLYWQRHKPAPLEIASIAITRQSLPRSRLGYCSAARLPSRCRKENWTATKTAAWLYWKMQSHASQLAATQRAPPGVQPAARPDKKNATAPVPAPASQLTETQNAPDSEQFRRPATNRTWLTR